MFFFMDLRNKVMIKGCEDVAKKLEKHHAHRVPGIYTRWSKTEHRFVKYDLLIPAFYIIAAVISLVAAIVSAVLLKLDLI